MKMPCYLTITTRLIALAVCLLPLQATANTQVVACFQRPQGAPVPPIPSDPELVDILRIPNCIKVDSVELGVESEVTIGSATGGIGAGRASFKEVILKKKTDGASPILFLNLVSSTRYQQIILFFLEEQASAGVVSLSTLATWQLGTAFVTKLNSVNETQIEENPVKGAESVAITFGEIRTTVGSTSTCWSQITNTNNCVNTPPLSR